MLLYISDTLDIISIIFELVGAALIGIGGIVAFKRAMFYWVGHVPHYTLNHIRLELGKSMLLGLDFFVCGDLVRTIGAQDYSSLGLLLLLVVIRTILTYFLNKEMKQLTCRDDS